MAGLQKYPDPDLDFCYFCQDTQEKVGHSTLNCPESKCKECGVSGHIVKNCPVLMHANDFRKLTQATMAQPLPTTSQNFLIKQEPDDDVVFVCNVENQLENSDNLQLQVPQSEPAISKINSFKLPVPVPSIKDEPEQEEEVSNEENVESLNQKHVESSNQEQSDFANLKIKVNNEYYTEPRSISRERQPKRLPLSGSPTRSRSNSKERERWRSRSRSNERQIVFREEIPHVRPPRSISRSRSQERERWRSRSRSRSIDRQIVFREEIQDVRPPRLSSRSRSQERERRRSRSRSRSHERRRQSRSRSRSYERHSRSRGRESRDPLDSRSRIDLDESRLRRDIDLRSRSNDRRLRHTEMRLRTMKRDIERKVRTPERRPSSSYVSGVQLNTPVRNPGAQNRENSYPQNFYNLPPSRTQNPRSSPPRPPRSQNNLPPRTQYPHNSAGINSNSYRKRPGLGTGKFDTTRINSVEDLEKHPEIKKNLEKVAKNTNVISALFEVSTKLHWTPPNFKESFVCGPEHKRHFIFKVALNGKDYQPTVPNEIKKTAKANAAKFALQELGLIPKDPNNPL